MAKSNKIDERIEIRLYADSPQDSLIINWLRRSDFKRVKGEKKRLIVAALTDYIYRHASEDELMMMHQPGCSQESHTNKKIKEIPLEALSEGFTDETEKDNKKEIEKEIEKEKGKEKGKEAWLSVASDSPASARHISKTSIPDSIKKLAQNADF